MDIDGCRLVCADPNPSIARRATARRTGVVPIHKRPAREAQAEGRMERRGNPEVYAAERPSENLGRWPANLILEHPGCQKSGSRPAKGYVINRWDDGAKPFGGGAGHPYSSEPQSEEVEVWDCIEGCPVAALDEQSGFQKSGTAIQRHGGGQKIGGQGIYGGSRGLVRQDAGFEDSGGASRFFKQVGGTKE